MTHDRDELTGLYLQGEISQRVGLHQIGTEHLATWCISIITIPLRFIDALVGQTHFRRIAKVTDARHNDLITRSEPGEDSISPEVQQNESQGPVRLRPGAPGVRQNQRVNVPIVLDQRDNVLKVERGAFVDGGSVAYRVQAICHAPAVTLAP